MNACKQSAVTFEVFVLWLHNQHCYTRDVIGIKMTHRNLLNCEGIRAKTRREYKLHENKHKNPANPLHTFTKLVPAVLRLIFHLMAWTAIYSSRDSDIIKNGRPNQDCRSVKKTSCHFSSLHTK